MKATPEAKFTYKELFNTLFDITVELTGHLPSQTGITERPRGMEFAVEVALPGDLLATIFTATEFTGRYTLLVYGEDAPTMYRMERVDLTREQLLNCRNDLIALTRKGALVAVR